MRTDQEYQELVNSGRFGGMTVDDMKWIDENVKEDPLLVWQDTFLTTEITVPMKRKAEQMAQARQINGKQAIHVHDTVEYYGALGELVIRKILYENRRKYEWKDIRGQSDNGVDVTIKAGTVDVKTSYMKPLPTHRVICRADLPHKCQYYGQVFIDGDTGIFVGMIRGAELIQEKNLGNIKSQKYNSQSPAYMVSIYQLPIKAKDILTDDYTEPII